MTQDPALRSAEGGPCSGEAIHDVAWDPINAPPQKARCLL